MMNEYVSVQSSAQMAFAEFIIEQFDVLMPFDGSDEWYQVTFEFMHFMYGNGQ